MLGVATFGNIDVHSKTTSIRLNDSRIETIGTRLHRRQTDRRTNSVFVMTSCRSLVSQLVDAAINITCLLYTSDAADE